MTRRSDRRGEPRRGPRASPGTPVEPPAGPSELPVDRSALAPFNSYSGPPFLARGTYLDTPFTCADCGVVQVWTASQQKWWYEVAKGHVFATAKRCRACRRRRRGLGTPAA